MVSVSLNYDTITFTSTYLNPSNMNSLQIKFSKNCGTVGSNINLNSLISGITNNTVTVPVATLIPLATVFPDGVYNFTFTIGTDDAAFINSSGALETGPGVYTISFCIYIGTTTRCKALANLLETDNELMALLIKALTNVDECDNCDCTTMCTVYDYLVSLLDSSTSTTTTNVSNNCGCA